MSSDVKTFPPRRWYRKVPLMSTQPIDKPLAIRDTTSAPSSNDEERRGGNEAGEEKIVIPEATASWISILTFGWLGSLLRTGYTRPLQANDLYKLPDTRLSRDYAEKLEKYWTVRQKVNQAHCESTTTSKWRPFWARRVTNATVMAFALNDVLFRRFWLGGFLKLGADIAQMCSPLFIRYLVSTLSEPTEQAMRAGIGYAVGLFLVLLLAVLGNVHGFYKSYTTGILLRGALLHVIYRRATTQLTERAKLKHDLSTGKLMSLMSADITRIDFCCGFFHTAWTSIIQILLCFALTVWTINYSALPGFGLLLLLYPLQRYMTSQLFRLRRASMPFTDARVKAVVEAVSTVRLIKANAYEKSVLTKIGKLRYDEVVFIRKRMLLRALNLAVTYTAPTLAAVVSIVCYGATNEAGAEASVVFSALAFFLLLRTPMQMLPVALSSIADARAALERISSFMLASNADTSGSDAEMAQEECPPAGILPDDVILHTDRSTFAYHDDDGNASGGEKDVVSAQVPALPASSRNKLYLHSFQVKRGQAVCIAGPVACGKSSVIRVLLDEMELIEGRGTVFNIRSAAASGVAYAPQTPWLISDTVRENIVFGRPLDHEWYDEVLTRCCLHHDLDRMSEGDLTVVGEMGISLSGGQKQRISLARAIYGKSPLLLLDDCFSALDANVSGQVFAAVVKKSQIVEGTTIILATHSMALARQCDSVVYMEKGRIVEQGPYEVLFRRRGSFFHFAGSLASTLPLQTDQNELKEEVEGLLPDDGGTKSEGIDALASQTQSNRGKEIMQKEERLVGSVSGSTYVRYVKMGRAWATIPLFIGSIVFFQGTSILSPLWLSWWQDNRYQSISRTAYMAGYAVFGIGQSLGLFCMSACFALFCFWCSNKLHRIALLRVLHAPVAFFDTTPQGRITHRFSKDVDAVDNTVGETLRLFISTTAQVIGTIIVIAIVLPWFLAIAAVVLLMFVWTGIYFRPSSRELRRLNNLFRGRIYEHFSESLSGLSTLKAFGAVSRFVDENARRIDTENTAYWLSVASQRWLNLRLDMYGAVLVLATGLLVIGLRGHIHPSAGGVIMSYIVTMQAVFGHMIRQSAEIENQMSSVERMLHYASEIKQEPPYEVEAIDRDLVDRGWPEAGQVEFQNVTLSHRSALEPVLKNITFTIKPGDKIGIVGRTGAGKTTMISALLRLIDPTCGRILVDGVDISKIGLHILRSSIAIISQEAVLLTGTVRYNLDPSEEHDDKWLQQCLVHVGLLSDQKEDVISFDTRSSSTSGRLDLDFEVKEKGANISQGERALISFARALVRRSRIFILDEATASIDGKADMRIQNILCTMVQDVTTLTVAHRLDTIVGTCNKVVVLDQGVVKETGHIPELFAKEDSLFRGLCDASGTTI